jgi:hypothetical protein
VGPQQVARRDLRDAVALDQSLGLRALARAGRTEQNNIQAVVSRLLRRKGRGHFFESLNFDGLLAGGAEGLPFNQCFHCFSQGLVDLLNGALSVNDNQFAGAVIMLNHRGNLAVEIFEPGLGVFRGIILAAVQMLAAAALDGTTGKRIVLFVERALAVPASQPAWDAFG